MTSTNRIRQDIKDEYGDELLEYFFIKNKKQTMINSRTPFIRARDCADVHETRPTRTHEFRGLIALERQRQIEKWGDNKLTLPEEFLILQEEIGEAASEAHDIYFKKDYGHQIEDYSPERLKKELIQCATVIYRIWNEL